ncbi:hypothetical protein [Nostoc sp.]|uniref:hypothetical protein n=1 Tax=Nostoc sp. TaxID=1180 RepID=UPI002FFABB97
MATLNNDFINLILDKEITDYLYNLLFAKLDASSESISKNRQIAFLLFKTNIALFGRSDIDYRQALVISYIRNLLDKLVTQPDFWTNISDYIRKQPLSNLPPNIKDIQYNNTNKELILKYKKEWEIAQDLTYYQIQNLETTQTKKFIGDIKVKVSTISTTISGTAKKRVIKTKINEFYVDKLPTLKATKKIENVATSNKNTNSLEYNYNVQWLTPEIFNGDFYKDVWVKTNVSETDEKTGLPTDFLDEGQVAFTLKTILQKPGKKEAQVSYVLNNRLISSELKILVKPDFITKTLQAVLAFDFTNIGYKPILAIKSYK